MLFVNDLNYNFLKIIKDIVLEFITDINRAILLNLQ